MSAGGLSLAYGDQRIQAPAPLAGRTVLEAQGLQPAGDPAALWRRAAQAAAAHVASVLGARGHLALVVPDRTRPLPLPALLPPLLDALSSVGIGPSRVTIVPASGIHRPMTHAELGAWIGADAAYSRASLAPHDADAPGVVLGAAASGIPVEAHAAVARAGGVLVLGRIVFHYLAGFGGGRKMLVPGVAARRTVIGVHATCLAPKPGAGRHPRAATGVLEGNPVHEAATEAARLFPPAAAIHIQLTATGALADASFGNVFGDHRRAAEAYARAFRAVVDEPLDAVIVSAGGHPTDRDLVQAHKALEAVAPVVKDGGSIVLVAACPEGVGNLELRQGLALGPAEAIEKELRREFRVGVQTALALRLKTTRLRVLALTELPDDLLALAGMERVISLEDAARLLYERHGPGARIAFAPRGSSLLYVNRDR